jgi:hypothetical protein
LRLCFAISLKLNQSALSCFGSYLIPGKARLVSLAALLECSGVCGPFERFARSLFNVHLVHQWKSSNQIFRLCLLLCGVSLILCTSLFWFNVKIFKVEYSRFSWHLRLFRELIAWESCGTSTLCYFPLYVHLYVPALSRTSRFILSVYSHPSHLNSSFPPQCLMRT